MNGLIVAGVASIAGIAGVAGITLATADTGPAPAPAAVSTPAPRVVAQRLARVREAERAADAVLRRTDPGAVVPPSASTAGPTLSHEGHHGREDAGEHRGRGAGRARSGPGTGPRPRGGRRMSVCRPRRVLAFAVIAITAGGVTAIGSRPAPAAAPAAIAPAAAAPPGIAAALAAREARAAGRLRLAGAATARRGAERELL